MKITHPAAVSLATRTKLGTADSRKIKSWSIIVKSVLTKVIIMCFPVFFVLFFLTAIAGTVPANQEEVPEEKIYEEYIDEKKEFEVAKDEKASFEFRYPEFLNGNHEKYWSSWNIHGPDGWTICSMEPSFNWHKGSIERCDWSHMTINHTSGWYTSKVLLSPFHHRSAGIWEIERRYGNYMSPIIQKYSVNIYETEFDRKYNNTMYGVREGEIIVINFGKKNYENRECRLINRKTNKTYDLNTREHRFSGNRSGIQKIGDCGFRMQIETGSGGLWSLVEEFKWKRHRTDFRLSLNFSVSQEAKESSVWWFEDFPIVTTVKELENIWDSVWADSLPPDYWELERPDGKIFIRSNMSHEYINIDQVTKDDEGNWKIRKSSGDSIVLMETNLFVTVRDLPEVYYCWIEYSNNLEISTLNTNVPTASVLKNQNGKYLVGTYSKMEEYYERMITFGGGKISDEESTGEWEFSLNYGYTTLNGLIPGKNVTSILTRASPCVWKSVQRMKYVIRGEEIKVKCSANAPLTNCTLTNPNNVTKYFLDDNSLITRTNCYNKEGFCGCIVTIKYANDTHSGTWKWEMEFEGSRKVNSLAPISVVDSYLITEIEQLTNGNEGNNFKINCRPLPTMHYRKIRYCKWFDSKNHQIFTGDPTKYEEIVEDDYCSLELKESYREDLDIWKCVAGLDGSSEEEIHATFDLLKISFNVTEDEPKEKLGQPSSSIVTISLIIDISWNHIYIFLVSLVAIIIAYTVLSKFKYIQYGRIPTDEQNVEK